MRRKRKASWKDPFFGTRDGQRRRRVFARQGLVGHAERMALGSGLPYKGWGKRSVIRDSLARVVLTARMLWRRYVR